MTEQQLRQTGALSVNPANGQVIERFPWLSAAARDAVLAKAVSGFTTWRALSLEERTKILQRVADYFRQHTERMARSVSAEMGKPIRQAKAEVEKCARACDWYVEHGPAMLADEPTPVEGNKAYVSFLPLGVILGVLPWNFPVWQVMRAAVPILLAGNAVVIKPAPNVVRSTLNVMEAFETVGAPPGLLSVLNIHQDDVAAVIADPRIAAVTLTGSVRAGAAVAAEAGRNIKKSVLELGGSDPFIVLADADLDRAVPAAVEARFQNTGQICIAAKRMIVEKPIAAEFTRRLVEAVEALRIGDPQHPDTYIGPMARRDLRDALADQIERTVREGARLLIGGTIIGPEEGYFYAPTVLSDVRPEMTAFREETFGPVASVIVAKDIDDAFALANDSEYGLSGALWTADSQRARVLARRLETGGVFINGFSATDPRTPVGGIKKSGYGRELSYFGIREFTNPQIVWQDR
jgi:succinate-semialdehyde dehydrogenase